jgi:hypothetical protein
MRFHPFFTEIRKKLGEGCFRTRKKGIEYGKNRIPRNPRTSAQQSVRTTYGKAVQDWKQLTPSERESYNERAKQLKISGWNLFVKEAFMIAWYEVTIDNTANPNTLTDYQICVKIIADSEFFEDADNRQATIRCYDSDKTTLLNHYTELFDTANFNAEIWIKIPSIPANSIKKVYIKLDQSLVEDVSDPEVVFDFWDDFDTFDTAKWGITANATATVENSVLILTATTDADGIYTLQNFPQNRVLTMRVLFYDPTNSKHAQGFKSLQKALEDYTDQNAVEFSSNSLLEEKFAAANYDTGDLCYDTIPSLTPATWYELIIEHLSDRTRFSLNGQTYEVTYLGCIPTVNLPIRITPSSTNETRVAYIFIRKGTYPEPSISYAKL